MAVSTLVKYPGQGRQGRKMLQPKATGWLLHQQLGAAPAPGGWGSSRQSAALQSERSLGESGPPPFLPSARVPSGDTPPSLCEKRACPRPPSERWLWEVGPLSTHVQGCWPWPSPAVGQAGLSGPNSFLLWLLVPWGCVGWRPLECQAGEGAPGMC